MTRNQSTNHSRIKIKKKKKNIIFYSIKESSVYRCCQCCASGRFASSCPSCYFCELFYGCPLYCWILTLLLLLLPMLALFEWLLSEQPGKIRC
jgi:hypothetical protein